MDVLAERCGEEDQDGGQRPFGDGSSIWLASRGEAPPPGAECRNAPGNPERSGQRAIDEERGVLRATDEGAQQEAAQRLAGWIGQVIAAAEIARDREPVGQVGGTEEGEGYQAEGCAGQGGRGERGPATLPQIVEAVERQCRLDRRRQAEGDPGQCVAAALVRQQ